MSRRGWCCARGCAGQKRAASRPLRQIRKCQLSPGATRRRTPRGRARSAELPPWMCQGSTRCTSCRSKTSPPNSVSSHSTKNWSEAHRRSDPVLSIAKRCGVGRVFSANNRGGVCVKRALTPDNAALSERRCPPPLGCRPTKDEEVSGASLVYSNTRSESPVVARSSVVGDFWDHPKLDALLGCHCRAVAGYPWFTSTRVTKSG